jgi:aspartate racemase
MPVCIRNIIEFFVSNGIGYILSRNKYAGTCREARNERNRLGHTGIPLYDELKSIVGEARDNTGEIVVIAMHCRGHMEVDFNIVKELLKLSSNINILPVEELNRRFGLAFGTVNPVLLQVNSKCPLIQMFDIGVTKPISKYPGTMMTNAGSHTWGMEFDPNVLIENLSNKYIESIAFQDRELQTQDLPHCTNPKSVGIITGNGPDSGIALWKGINNYILEIFGEHFLGDMSLPEVRVISVPAMGLSMELENREQPTWEVLSKAVTQLKVQNVDLLALACHTTHYFENKIRKLFDSETQRFVSMSEVVTNYIKVNGIEEMAVLGINYVADLKEWSAYSELNNYKIEHIDDATMAKFHVLGYDVKQMTNIHRSFQQLIRLIKNDIKSKNIVIALTELSILLESGLKKAHSAERNIIDSLDLYAKEIAKLSLGLEIER